MIVLIVMSVALILTSALYLDMRRRYHKVSLDAAKYAVACDSEYSRAMDEGKRMVREWAVEANYNLYTAEGSGMYVPNVRAAFQDAIGQFRPRNWRSI